MIPPFFRYTYVHRGTIVPAERKSPIYYVVTGTCFFFHHTDTWRIKRVIDAVNSMWDDMSFVVGRVFNEDMGESTERVDSREAVGLGFYRMLVEVHRKGLLVWSEKADLRFR